MQHTLLRFLSALLVSLCALQPAYAQRGEFMSAQQYRQKIFGKEVPWQTLWPSKELRQTISEVLQRPYQNLRVRYWGEGQKTAWIFEEIGKERPITIAVTVEQNRIVDLTILAFRESRGGEVRHSFFTEQFIGAALQQAKQGPELNQTIDGITGATLSVRAVKKVATLALLCHRETPFNSAP